MSDILFLSLDAPAPGVNPADDYAPWDALALHDAAPTAGACAVNAGDAERAVAESVAGCAAARAGRWDAAAEALRASAERRARLVASGHAGASVAARGWSDVAVLAAVRDDAVGAADALARARVFAADADRLPADVCAALDDVTTWLGALGGAVGAAFAPATQADAGDAHTSRSSEPWALPPARSLDDAALDELADLLLDTPDEIDALGETGAPETPEPSAPAAPHALAAEFAAEFATALAVAPLVHEPAAHELAAPAPPAVEPPVAEPLVVEPSGIQPSGIQPSVVEPPVVELAGAEPLADDLDDRTDTLVFLPVDDEPAPESATAGSAPGDRAWTAFEGPLRPWERPDGASDAPLTAPVCALPAKRAPLAPPLAPALRNAKIDEAVALATAAPERRTGKLRGLLDRFKRG